MQRLLSSIYKWVFSLFFEFESKLIVDSFDSKPVCAQKWVQKTYCAALHVSAPTQAVIRVPIHSMVRPVLQTPSRMTTLWPLHRNLMPQTQRLKPFTIWFRPHKDWSHNPFNWAQVNQQLGVRPLPHRKPPIIQTQIKLIILQIISQIIWIVGSTVVMRTTSAMIWGLIKAQTKRNSKREEFCQNRPLPSWGPGSSNTLWYVSHINWSIDY